MLILQGIGSYLQIVNINRNGLIKEGLIIMRNSFQKFMLMLLALFLVLSPVSPVLAADEQDDPQPSLEKGDEKEDIQPGRDSSTDSSEEIHLERDRSWDGINREVPDVKNPVPNEQEDRSTWETSLNVAERVFGIVSVYGKEANPETNITLVSNIIGVPIALNKSDMTDGQKFGADFALYSADLMVTGREWSKALKYPGRI